MALTPGTRPAPYKIRSALGAGGMSEVWKARDSRLNRLVAIKASHSRFGERFERKAGAIAAVTTISCLFALLRQRERREGSRFRTREGPEPHGAAAMIGQTLGHYRIEASSVRAAWAWSTGLSTLISTGRGHQNPARRCHCQPRRKRRFVQEAKAASALNHPNIVHIYDIGTSADGTDFIAMEFVPARRSTS